VPSQPGGGGSSLADCMGFWDRGPHMSKQEWRASCQRTLHRLDSLKGVLDQADMTSGAAKKNDTTKVEKNGAKSRTPTQ
jgi:hypothetical protein